MWPHNVQYGGQCPTIFVHCTHVIHDETCRKKGGKSLESFGFLCVESLFPDEVAMPPNQLLRPSKKIFSIFRF